jgi:hypothetical protein
MQKYERSSGVYLMGTYKTFLLSNSCSLSLSQHFCFDYCPLPGWLTQMLFLKTY